MRRVVLLLLAALATSSLGAMPRIVPLSLRRAQHVLHLWDRPAFAPRDGVECGAVGLVRDAAVHAVAVLERDATRVHLCRLECDDDASGTMLLKALAFTAPALTHELEPRWAIALAYFRASAKKTEGPPDNDQQDEA
jgi:hypothetical protein